MKTIRKRCAVAALVAATACGGSPSRVDSSVATDAHQGPDQVCGACTVQGAGEVQVDGVAVAIRADVSPDSNAPSTNGAFIVAGKGFLVTQLSCTRERGVLRASVSGYGLGVGVVTMVVTDGGEAGETVSVTQDNPVPGHLFTPVFGAQGLATGALQITALEQCSAACGEGQCLCPEDHLTCEPCAGHAPEPPPPPATLPL